MDETPFLRLAVAVAIGLLVGLERGWRTRALPEGHRVAGFRTFSLIGIVGGASGLLAAELGAVALLGGFLGVTALLVLGFRDGEDAEDDRGITTAVAALAVFALGALAGLGAVAVAASGAVVMALLLGSKPELHALVNRIERSELLATLRLLLLSVVVLTALPDRPFGPWGALNPYRIWWMVVLIATISYLGYFAIKLLGPRRGLVGTALLGGLVSSTAVTVGFARHARAEPAAAGVLAAGIALASAVMLARAAVVAIAVAPSLAVALGGVLAVASVVTLGGAGVLLLRGGEAHLLDEGTPRSPLDLGGALFFGGLIAVVTVLVHGARELVGDAALVPLALVAGLADVDAIILSIAGLVRDGFEAGSIAVGAILAAIAANTMVKPVLAAIAAGPRFALLLALPLAAGLAAGAVVFALGG